MEMPVVCHCNGVIAGDFRELKLVERWIVVTSVSPLLAMLAVISSRNGMRLVLRCE